MDLSFKDIMEWWMEYVYCKKIMGEWKDDEVDDPNKPVKL